MNNSCLLSILKYTTNEIKFQIVLEISKEKYIFVSTTNNKGQLLSYPILKTIIHYFNFKLMSNLQNSVQENNYYLLSYTEDKILVGSDHKEDFEIDLADFEYYLTLIDRIGIQYHASLCDEYDETEITMEEWLSDNDQTEIDQHLTEYIINGGSKQEPDLSEVPLPVSDPYELAEVGQRPIYEEQRYLAHIV